MPQATRERSMASGREKAREFLERFRTDDPDLFERLGLSDEYEEDDNINVLHREHQFNTQLGEGVILPGNQPAILVEYVKHKVSQKPYILVQKAFTLQNLRSEGFDLTFFPSFDANEMAVSDLFEVVEKSQVVGECELVTEEQFRYFHSTIVPTNVWWYKHLLSLDLSSKTYKLIQYKNVREDCRDLVIPNVTDKATPCKSTKLYVIQLTSQS
jgi:hypothetical protein